MRNHLLAPLLLALTPACHHDRDHGTLALLITDAPVPFELVQRATVSIDRITIDCGPDSLQAVRTIYDGEPIVIDVTSLRNGRVQHFLSHQLPITKYRRMHVRFCAAEIEFVNGHRFSTAEGTMLLPESAAGEGIDFAIDIPLKPVHEHWMRLLIDFDVPRSFVPKDTSDPLTAESFQFEPLVHLVYPGLCGEIRGLVQRDDGSGNLVPVSDATIYFLPSGTESIEMASAATASDPDGSFAKVGLPPGSYDVLARKGTDTIVYRPCLVYPGDYAVVELTLP
jgi:hypothetical protein